MRQLLPVSLLMIAFAARPAVAQEPETFGPGKVWCASQMTCHLHLADNADYGFNALALSPVLQQALLGPCQQRKDCTAELVGVKLPNLALLGDVRALKWEHGPPEFVGRH